MIARGRTPSPPDAALVPVFAEWPYGGGSSVSFSHPQLLQAASASHPAVLRIHHTWRKCGKGDKQEGQNITGQMIQMLL